MALVAAGSAAQGLASVAPTNRLASLVLRQLRLALPVREIALILWDSLTDDERDAELELGPERRAELDRRWAEHLTDPASAIPWDDVRRRLGDRR